MEKMTRVQKLVKHYQIIVMYVIYDYVSKPGLSRGFTDTITNEVKRRSLEINGVAMRAPKVSNEEPFLALEAFCWTQAAGVFLLAWPAWHGDVCHGPRDADIHERGKDAWVSGMALHGPIAGHDTSASWRADAALAVNWNFWSCVVQCKPFAYESRVKILNRSRAFEVYNPEDHRDAFLCIGWSRLYS
ncbi:hypothetical protein SELMODRAFT_426426 [Selaginella moellendorffii]|uniref:Uncharacterized protein n=1 Tax=Selaginella moellendorffii TaxID=88036 RepID=D8SWB8_SELML|nr:hypothetical protein SELMODRAFT_426426 [Selaginella moellendorffii]